MAYIQTHNSQVVQVVVEIKIRGKGIQDICNSVTPHRRHG
ncbi:MAG: hypothetical protein ACI8RD_000088 [Bacillariaceae sp.]|jgi:hypothetical protein